MNNHNFFKNLLICLLIFCQTAFAYATDLKTEIKESTRKLFSNISQGVPANKLGKLPMGFSIIEGNGYRGFMIEQGKLEIRVHTWSEDSGLLENFFAQKEAGLPIIAAVNGTFYSSRGVLGSIISDGSIPRGIMQIPGKLSRCFLSSFRGRSGRQTWYLGESSISGNMLFQSDFRKRGWFNISGGLLVMDLDNLISGGGWILRERRDVHREAFDRQRFRFRREDQTSRKTVIAQDSDRRLYFIVFETGQSFHQVARAFVKEVKFEKVREAIFLDGGSSSAIVINGKYFVPPLYLVDKSRFSCVQILIPDIVW